MWTEAAISSTVTGWSKCARIQDAVKTSFSAYPRFDPQRRTVPYRDILEAARSMKPGVSG